MSRKLFLLKYFLAIALSENLFLDACFAESVWMVHLHADSSKESKPTSVEYKNLSSAVKSRTSIEMSDWLQELNISKFMKPVYPDQGWAFANIQTLAKILDPKLSAVSYFAQWLRQGGFLILEEGQSGFSNTDTLLKSLEERLSYRADVKARWREIPVEHELMRSFFLHTSFPSCKNRMWKVLEYDQRTVGVYAPFPWMEWLKDQNWSKIPEISKRNCDHALEPDFLSKVFVNVVMTALTTDYKMDQIHLPEILKRLQ